MENEKTDSCALVPVEEVEADLIFEPGSNNIQINGYGSRKIIRESLINQLKIGYQVLNFESVEVKKEIVLSRHEKSTESILNVIKNSECCTRNMIVLKTGLSKTTVIRILNEMYDAGRIDEGVLNRTHYYRIAVK